jgi:HAD superfamily hydrolase (TIGR01509 family)
MKTILVDAVNAFVIPGEGIFQEMHDFLEKYPNKKIILTGADDEQIKKFGLDEMPYEVFTLKHDPEKTNPEYWENMLKYFGLTAGDCVYFEHDKEAVEVAKAVGIEAYHYDNENKDLDALKAFIDDKLNL